MGDRHFCWVHARHADRGVAGYRSSLSASSDRGGGACLILGGATAIWLYVSALTWVDRSSALVAFVLGVLVVGQLTFRPLGPFTLSDLFFFASLEF